MYKYYKAVALQFLQQQVLFLSLENVMKYNIMLCYITVFILILMSVLYISVIVDKQHTVDKQVMAAKQL